MYRQPAPFHPLPPGASGEAVGFAMGAVIATTVGLCSLAFLADNVVANSSFGIVDCALSLLFFGCVTVIVRLAILAQKRHAAYVAERQAIQVQQEQQAREEAAQRDGKAYPERIGALQGLLKLAPTQFELAIADLLKFWGYTNVEHTGVDGDLATYIVCYDAAGQKTVVQCKRNMPGTLVSLPEVQTFIDMIVAHHNELAGIYITTSGYAEPALALGQIHHIMMIDGTNLVDYFRRFRAAIEQQG